MKKEMIVLAVSTIIVGILSMGCLSAPVEEPDNGGLTAKGLQVKADVAERQARGFVQYTGTIVPGTAEAFYEDLGYDINLYKCSENFYPVLSYSRCFASIPENVAGFDTPMERAYVLQGELNRKMDLLYNGMTQQRYQYRGEQAYTEFYQGYYQDKIDKYTKMYCGVGNKVIGDFEIDRPIKISLNGSE